MPYKCPAKRAEYMREYRRKQRQRKPCKPDTQIPILKADPNHVQRLQQARGKAVATPQGRGTVLEVSRNDVRVGIAAGVVVTFRCEQVGLW